MMGFATILSLDECRDTQRRVEIRQRLRDRFDHWLGRLEDQVKAPKSTLEELIQALTESLVDQLQWATVEQRPSVSPRCGQPLAKQAPMDHTVETRGGTIGRWRL